MSADNSIEIQSGRQGSKSRGSLRLEGRTLTLARVAWVLITLVGVSVFIAGVPLRYQELLVPCVGDGCSMGQLSPEGMQALQNAGFSPTVYAAFNIVMAVILALVYCLVGLVIFLRQSREWVALLGSLWLVLFGVTFGEGEVRALAATYPLLGPLVLLMTYLGGVVLFQLFLFVFPDGRFVPRWARWIYLVTIILFVIFGSLEFILPDFYASIRLNGVALWISMVFSGVVAQVYRYLRVSGPIERQQTKWIVFGLLIMPLATAVLLVLGLVGPTFNQPGLNAVADTVLQLVIGTFVFMMIPVTLGFSILRYRIWDTDIIINRTLVYGLLTVLLLLVYFGSVLMLQTLFTAVTSQGSPLAIVVSTLVIAALFQPLRRKLQDLIDRRFYRRKYDAAQTLEQFAIAARDEVDLDRLAAELVRSVEEAMQPDKVMVWLKEKE